MYWYKAELNIYRFQLVILLSCFLKGQVTWDRIKIPIPLKHVWKHSYPKRKKKKDVFWCNNFRVAVVNKDTNCEDWIFLPANWSQGKSYLSFLVGVHSSFSFLSLDLESDFSLSFLSLSRSLSNSFSFSWKIRRIHYFRWGATIKYR